MSALRVLPPPRSATMKTILRTVSALALAVGLATGAHAAANLSVTGVSANPGSVQPGKSATFTVAISNSSVAPTVGVTTANDFTGGSADVAITLSSITADPIFLGTQSVSIPAIKAGGSGNVIASFSVPTRYSQAGDYYIRADVGFRPTGTAATASATLGGSVSAINMTAMGVNYSRPPTVTVAPPAGPGVTATARAILAAGAVIAIDVVTAGSGYTSAPTVTLTNAVADANGPADLTGSGSSATAVISASVASISLTSVGTGYGSLPQIYLNGGDGGNFASASASLGAGTVSGIALTNFGSGYTSAPTVTISGGGGAGATATATLNRSVSSIALVAGGGTGYAAPTVTLFGGGGTGATATVTASGGIIIGFTITAGGTGYTSAPTVIITDATGTGAAGTATVTGVVSGITLTSPGAGYTSAPSVTFAGGGGTGAAAVATASASLTSISVTNGGNSYATSPNVFISGGGPTFVGNGLFSTSSFTTLTPGLTVTGKPDLIITGVNYPAGVAYKGGDVIPMSLTYTNPASSQGTPTVPFKPVSGATTYFRIELVLSANSGFGDADDFRLILHDVHNTVNADGQTRTLSWNQLLPGNFPGSYFVLAKIDTIGGANGSVDETVESDFTQNGNNIWQDVAGTRLALLPTTFPTMYMASTATTGSSGNGHSDNPSITSDGRYAVYASDASDLVAGTAVGGADTNNARDIFIYDSQTGTTRRLNLSQQGSQANAGSATPAISAGGRYVAFSSDATNLILGDNNGFSDIFVVDVITGAITLDSVATNPSAAVLGVQGNGSSFKPSLSSDGRFLVFESSATNLAAGGTSVGVTHIYLRDRTTGVTTLVSQSSAGAAGNGNSIQGVISGDGKYVAFASIATNLVTGDTNNLRDVFLRDLTANTTIRVSVGPAAVQSITSPIGGDSRAPSISQDGRFVAFSSDAINLVPGDTNGIADIFVYDRTAATTSRVSISSAGNQATDPFGNPFVLGSINPYISATGRFVTFASMASNLAPGDAGGRFGTLASATVVAGAVTAINITNPGASAGGAFYTSVPSVTIAGGGGSGATATAILSGGSTGTVTGFAVNAPGTGYTSAPTVTVSGSFNSALNIYVADRDVSGSNTFGTPGNIATTLVSVNKFGYQTWRTFGAQSTAASDIYPVISADGRWVAMPSDALGSNGLATTTTNQLSNDSNTSRDVFLHDRRINSVPTVSSPPVVTITSPGNGGKAIVNTAIQVTASATAATVNGTVLGVVSSVQFFVNGSSLRTSTVFPYSSTWTPTAVGNYILSALVTDSFGNLGVSTNVIVTINAAPSVGLTSPVGGTPVTVNTAVNVIATAGASNPGATIQSVQFFANGVSIGTDTTDPFGVTWTPTATGAFTLTAQATDSIGTQSTSPAVTVTVITAGGGGGGGGTATPPIVTLTPALPTTASVNARVTLTAAATPGSATTTLTKVDFFAGTTLLGTATTAPYTFFWVPQALGTFAITAVATDNLGASTTSLVSSVNVNGVLAIAVNSPTTGSSIPVNTPQVIAATASATNGTVTSVQFLANGVAIGKTNAFPYVVNWTPTTPGLFTLTAVATDNTGAVANSLPTTVTVVTGTAPAVVLSSPAGGSSLVSGSVQTIIANASAGTGTIASVQFFANGVSLGTDTTFPYNFAWTPAGIGPFALTAVATDSLGNRTTSAPINVTAVGLSPGAPAVALTSPLGGASLPVSIPATIAATATDTDGTIANVQFFANGVSLGVDSTYPYSVPFTPTATGSYTLTAQATDNGGNLSTSAPVSVTVSGGNAPAVAIVGPVSGSVLNVNGAQTILANATSSGGVIASVQFFVNGTSLSTRTAFPYSAAWTPTAVGSFSLTARATDGLGNVTDSAPVLITVVSGSTSLPTVALTSTPNGTRIAVNSAVFIGANAEDPDGAVANVEFYVDGRLVGSQTAFPYFAQWVPDAPGTYVVKAIVTDDAGNRVTSATSTLTAVAPVGALPVTSLSFNSPAVDSTATPAAVNPLVPIRVNSGSKLILDVAALRDGGTITNVQFYANGTQIAALAAAPFFTTYQINTLSDVTFTALVTDSAGNTVFTNPLIIDTQPSLGAAGWVVTLVSPLEGFTTVNGAQITFSATHNFGTVVPPKIDFYLNGSQFTTVSSPTGSGASAPYQFVIGLTRAGTYIVHAVGRSGSTTTVSSPARIVVTSSRAPTVALTSPSPGSPYTIGTGLTVAANATSSTGLISSVQFFVNGAVLSSKNTTPYNAPWNPGAAGAYTITALATDDSGNQTLSAPLLVTLVPNAAPTVALTGPPTGTTVIAGTVVNLASAAADADGTVASVRFLANGNLVGTATAAPFSVSWTPTAAGAYNVTAQATDNSGNVTSSSAITINVTGNQSPVVALSTPGNGSVIRAGSGTTITASASDLDGTIASVQFLSNGVSIGAAISTLPYRTQWTPPAEGIFRITAVATDNAGAATTSTVFTVLAVSSSSGGSDNVYTGDYLGGGEIGRFAVITVRGKTAAFIGYSTTTVAKTYFYPGLAVDGGGNFSATDALGRTLLTASANETGVSGNLDGGRIIAIGINAGLFLATRTVAAGYYVGGLNGRSGSTLAAIVGADGSITAYLADGTFQTAGAGAVDAAGSFSLNTSSGGRLTGRADPLTGFLTGTLSGANGGAFMAATSSGASFSDGFLRNLSTRGQVGTGSNILIAGFVVGGTTAKQVLVRAVGPTLGGFGLTGVLADPQIQLFNGSNALVVANNNWGGAGDVIAASAQVGAFPLAANSLDAVVLASLAPGSYTAQVSGVGGTTGLALVELYDVDTLSAFSSQKVMNVATRGIVGTGQAQLIAGFVVSGSTPKKVLVRAVGPTLAAAPFNVAGVLADPILRLVRADNLVVRENDNWESGNDAALVIDASVRVGAFPLASGSNDAAILINLPPGTYNAQASGAGTTTGVALIEVYEVP